MCGIAGSVNFKITLSQVKSKMGHRGPDDDGIYHDKSVSLCHLRLAILDISGGIQPMHYLERYTIVFNGEIYNHLEVRRLLNLNCSRPSDTETILAAYHSVGAECLNYFDGMFAFCIYDKIQQTLFFARDRAGKKPLYYYHDGSKFVFSSELNLLHSLLNLEIEERNFINYYRLGAFYRSQTPYKNVIELLNGHYAKVDIASLKVETHQWWSIFVPYAKSNTSSEQEVKEHVLALIKQSVIRRMDSSDLEVGCFLSGGIDSGIITAIASEHRANLRTFTVSFDGQFDESQLAKLVSEKYNTRHETIPIAFDNLRNDIEKILYNYGEPFFDSSAIPSYYVAKAARKHITVVLNGDGADELFGGYRRFVPFAHFSFFDKSVIFRKILRKISKILPPAHNKKSKYNYLYRLVFLSSLPNSDLFVAAGPDIFEGFLDHFYEIDAESRKYFDSEIARILGSVGGSLNKLMALDFEINLFSDLLVKMDIASMANSLETRSPMLGKEILEYAPTLPGHFKIRGSTTKFLLRNIASDLLPSVLVNQPKRGFEVPLKDWVNNMLSDIIMDYLHATDTFYTRFIPRQKVEQMLQRKWRVSEEKRAKMIWSLFCAEVWYKKCYLNSNAKL